MRLKGSLSTKLKISILGIFLIIIALLIFNYYKPTNVDNGLVLAIADNSDALSTLNKLVANQNKYIDCLDEVKIIYQEQGIPTSGMDEKKICKTTIEKSVVRKDDENYIVIYTQVMPDECKSSNTQSNLLNVTVNVRTNKTTASWISGSDPSQLPAFSIIEELVDAPDCNSYVDILNSTL